MLSNNTDMFMHIDIPNMINKIKHQYSDLLIMSDKLVVSNNEKLILFNHPNFHGIPQSIKIISYGTFEPTEFTLQIGRQDYLNALGLDENTNINYILKFKATSDFEYQLFQALDQLINQMLHNSKLQQHHEFKLKF